jgi:hypothetical protein
MRTVDGTAESRHSTPDANPVPTLTAEITGGSVGSWRPARLLPDPLALDHSAGALDWAYPDASGMAVMLTAIEAEYLAVRAHLAGVRRVGVKGTLFDVGTFPGEAGTWMVAVAQTGPSGEAAGAHVERAISRFNPSVAMFIGTAGGLRDVELADVVVATDVYDYDSGKDTARGQLARVKTRSSTYRLIQLAHYVSRAAPRGGQRGRLRV